MSDEGIATIIDTKKMINTMENNDKLTRMKNTKKLNKIANLEIEGEMQKNKNPFEGLKIPRSALRKKAGGRKKKSKMIDFEKFTVNEYTYDEFSKAVNSILPAVINHASFKDDAFLKKLKSSKDIKHFADSQIMFPITNDYIGFGGAVLGCALEYYTENKMNVSIATEKTPKQPQEQPPPQETIQI